MWRFRLRSRLAPPPGPRHLRNGRRFSKVAGLRTSVSYADTHAQAWTPLRLRFRLSCRTGLLKANFCSLARPYSECNEIPPHLRASSQFAHRIGPGSAAYDAPRAASLAPRRTANRADAQRTGSLQLQRRPRPPAEPPCKDAAPHHEIKRISAPHAQKPKPQTHRKHRARPKPYGPYP